MFLPCQNMRNNNSFFYDTIAILLTTVILLSCSSSPCCAGLMDVKKYPGAYGDPHFTGWDGINFDFTGEPGGIYCIISDADLHVNMELKGEQEDIEEEDATEDGKIRVYSQNKNEEHIKKTEKETTKGKIRVYDNIKKDRKTVQGGFRVYNHMMKKERSESLGERSRAYSDTKKDGGIRVYKNRTWIKALGIMYRGHRIVMKVRGGGVGGGERYMKSIEVDGERWSEEIYRSKDGSVNVSYEGRKGGGGGGDMAYEEYKLELGLGFGGVMEMRVKAGPEVPEERRGGGAEAFPHLSVEVVGGSELLTGNVHGILGQTLLNARGRALRESQGSYTTSWNPLLVQRQVDGPNADGYLDGSASDYLASGLLHSDCRFSRFDPNGGVRPASSVTITSPYSRRRLIPV